MKYEFTGETREFLGRTLHRIKAVSDFGDVKAGDLGGWVEKEENLSQAGDCWVYGNAWVSGSAQVSGNARVGDKNHVLWISPIGSRDDTVTFMRTKDHKIAVSVGCFYGSVDEFERAVLETHGNNEHAQAYKLAIELAKLRIDLNEKKENEDE